MDEDFERISREIDQQIRQANEHAERMRVWADDVDRISGEGTAMRGAVKVSVNNSGVLTGLTLTDAALDAGARGLATAILDAIGAAKQVVADQMGRSAADQFGRDGEITQLMVADMNKRLGVTPDFDAPPAAGRPGGVIG